MQTSSINAKQDEIIEAFSLLDGDIEMANFYLMELGQKLKPLPESEKIEKNIVKGCQSKVWLKTELHGDQIRFSADSNTAITKGLVSLLVSVLSNQKVDDVIHADLYFIHKIGMDRFIGTQRSNGFAAMIKQMKMYAIAYKSKIESKAS